MNKKTGWSSGSRIRKYEELDFIYSGTTGFSCELSGMVDLYHLFNSGINESGYGDKANIKTILTQAGYAVLSQIVNSLTFALKCYLQVMVVVSTFESVTSSAGGSSKFQGRTSESAGLDSSGSGSGIYVVLNILVYFLEESFNEWIDSKIGGDDYFLDESNTHWRCVVLQIFSRVVCIILGAGLTVCFKLIKSGGLAAGAGLALLPVFFIVIPCIVDAIVYALTTPLYKLSAMNYDKMALCGDEWLVYGNEAIEDEVRASENFSSDKKYTLTEETAPSGFYAIEKGTLPIYNYPVKGPFYGSYKFLLDQCFSERNVAACKEVFKAVGVYSGTVGTRTVLDTLYDMKYRPYREYVYGGMEFANNGCIDPRAERTSYKLGTDRVIDSSVSVTTISRRSQLYYFKGSDSTNFACERFAESNDKEFREAYDCCLKASQDKICIRKQVSTTTSYNMCSKEDSPSDCTLTPYVGDDTSIFRFNYSGTKINTFATDIKTEIENIKTQDSSAWSGIQTEENKEDNDGDGVADGVATTDEASVIAATTPSSSQVSQVTGSLSKYDALLTDSNIEFIIKKSIFSDNRYCIESYNMCPYNFALKGGTEVYGNEFVDYSKSIKVKSDLSGEDTDNAVVIEKNKKNNCMYYEADSEGEGRGVKYCPGRCFEQSTSQEKEGEFLNCYGRPSNFCQVDRHCVSFVPLLEDEYNRRNPYLDKACMNFVGSTHNFYGYMPRPGYRHSRDVGGRNIIAPFVECFVETFKNMLLNEAGHTECGTPSEIPGNDVREEACPESGVFFLRGDELNSNIFPYPFIKMKDKLERTVKALAAISIVLYGLKLVITTREQGKLDAKALNEMMMKIFTLVFVLYISMSNNWIRPIFKMVLGSYNLISNMAMQIVYGIPDPNVSPYDSPEFPGCYFFKSEQIRNNYDAYGDKVYVALFDTLDCKIAFYMGIFGENVLEPPIVALVIASIFSFGLVIILVFPFIVLFIALILMCIKVAFAFIMSSMRCVVLLFATPIVAPMLLFDKTKAIFKKWAGTIFGLLFSCTFLLMGTGVFFMIFDKYYAGDVKFIGK
ncbi:MAG: type IV secretion system protein, partial [Rickettsiales bacterium]|nr:type IV secretion system protein [Rickettsiales bacterium]